MGVPNSRPASLYGNAPCVFSDRGCICLELVNFAPAQLAWLVKAAQSVTEVSLWFTTCGTSRNQRTACSPGRQQPARTNSRRLAHLTRLALSDLAYFAAALFGPLSFFWCSRSCSCLKCFWRSSKDVQRLRRCVCHTHTRTGELCEAEDVQRGKLPEQVTVPKAPAGVTTHTRLSGVCRGCAARGHAGWSTSSASFQVEPHPQRQAARAVEAAHLPQIEQRSSSPSSTSWSMPSTPTVLTSVLVFAYACISRRRPNGRSAPFKALHTARHSTVHTARHSTVGLDQHCTGDTPSPQQLAEAAV